MDNYIDIKLPPSASIKDLTSALSGIGGKPGEYRLSPVTVQLFDSWSERHPQFPFAIQFSGQTLVVSVLLPPHDRTAGIIGNLIARTVDRMCPAQDCEVMIGTGLTVLKNATRKNGDCQIYSHQSGVAPVYPGIVIEVGYSDSTRKSRRDIQLWIANSDAEVKIGIVCKMSTDAQKNITTLQFDIISFDFSKSSTTTPLGCPTTICSLDFSNYNGNPNTLPPVTTVDLPSYAVFSDGIYPPSYPPHQGPVQQEPMISAAMNATRQHPLSQNDLLAYNKHIGLSNNQRARIPIDFASLADRIREIRW